MSVNLNNPDNITKEISSIKSQLLKIRNIQANNIDELTDDDNEDEKEESEEEEEVENEIIEEKVIETEKEPEKVIEKEPEIVIETPEPEKQLTFSKYTKKEIKKYTNAFEVNILETEIQSIDTALAYSVEKFIDYGFSAKII